MKNITHIYIYIYICTRTPPPPHTYIYTYYILKVTKEKILGESIVKNLMLDIQSYDFNI